MNMSRILTSKYFLYAMVFLSATNILGYLVAYKTRPIVFFALICLLSSYFSKNMGVILLIGLLTTNLIMVGHREGFQDDADDSPSLERAKSVDPEIDKAVTAVKKSTTTEQAKEQLTKTSSKDDDNKTIDINNSDLNKGVKDANEPVGVGSNKKKGTAKTSENFGPRLDYAATIEQSYQNLDNILGSDSIKQLTNDTQKLMQQQQNLFNTMNQMVPVLEGAQNMLKNFKIDGLADSLKSMSALGSK